MKKRLLILICVLGLTVISAGVACATLILNFSNVDEANIEFVGNTDTFFFNIGTGGADFSIISGSGISDGTTVGLPGVISGSFTISGITGIPPFQTGTVAPTGTITITDNASKQLVLGVDWVNIFTFSNTGGLGVGATANLTFTSYAGGSNADLAAFQYGGDIVSTFQFNSDTSLTYLTTDGNNTKTSYSGSMSAIPLPPTALLLGTGLLGLVGLGWRRRKES